MGRHFQVAFALPEPFTYIRIVVYEIRPECGFAQEVDDSAGEMKMGEDNEHTR